MASSAASQPRHSRITSATVEERSVDAEERGVKMAPRLTRREMLSGAAVLIAGTGVGIGSHVDAAYAGRRPYRAFRDGSYWNTRIPDRVPVDPRSDRWIRWLAAHNPTPDVMVGGTSGWAHPIYFANDGDPLVTIRPARYTTNMVVRFRLPHHAVPMTGPDSEMSVVDRTTNQDVHLFGFGRRRDGTPTCEGIARYWLNSTGIAEASGGRHGNGGHRGIPGFAFGFRQSEIAAGAIRRRLKLSIPRTGPRHYWPLYADQGHDGVIPEGVVMRIKPHIRVGRRVSGGALVLARACQRYGVIVGDSTANRTVIKGQMGVDWTRYGMPADFHGLEAFPIARAWEFVQAGWRA